MKKGSKTFSMIFNYFSSGLYFYLLFLTISVAYIQKIFHSILLDSITSEFIVYAYFLWLEYFI